MIFYGLNNDMFKKVLITYLIPYIYFRFKSNLLRLKNFKLVLLVKFEFKSSM
jgi:hypothetical protein